MDDTPKSKFQLGKPRIAVMRHGQTEYRQPLAQWEEAQDLTIEGVAKVELQTQNLIQEIKKEQEIYPDLLIRLWSSPAGRTQHTAKIILNGLAKANLNIKKTARIPAFITTTLREVDNFSWDLFKAFVDGGDVLIGNKTYLMNKQITNPRNLNISKYFFEDEWHCEEVKSKLPPYIINFLNKIEKATDLSTRMQKNLNRLARLKDKHYFVILVTHDGLISALVNKLDKTKYGVQPADYIRVDLL